MSETVITICATLLASSGFWVFLQNAISRVTKRDDKIREIVREETQDIRNKTVEWELIGQAVMGTKHNELVSACMTYLERGYITPAELDDLDKYIYQPYKNLDGNGTGEKLMADVRALPTIKKEG